MGVIGRLVDRLDAEQFAVAVAEYRELAGFDIAADDGLVVAVGQAGNLQSERSLLAPEPRQRGVGMRLAEKAVGDAAGVVSPVLHRFEPRHFTPGLPRWEPGAIADRRDRRVSGQ